MPDVGGLDGHPVLVGVGFLELLGSLIVLVPGLDAGVGSGAE